MSAPRVAGGLVLEVSGDHLSGGDDYKCRFEGGSIATVSATHDTESNTVLCISPAGLLGLAQVRLSLNGQQYTENLGTGVALTFYDPDQLESLPLYGSDVVAEAYDIDDPEEALVGY